jgi:hypothetical protein
MKLFSFFKKRDVQKFPSNKLEKVANNLIKFLERSPYHSLPIPKFIGCGVYVLFYRGNLDFYKNLADHPDKPIYVGKAVPKGWRSGRISLEKEPINLWKRIKEHSNNILRVQNLDISDFECKYIILDTDLIAFTEAKLIRTYKPLWNCVVDGFGNHHPGTTRFNQAKPDWDVVHPGRSWAGKMTGAASTRDQIIKKIGEFLDA